MKKNSKHIPKFLFCLLFSIMYNFGAENEKMITIEQMRSLIISGVLKNKPDEAILRLWLEKTQTSPIIITDQYNNNLLQISFRFPLKVKSIQSVMPYINKHDWKHKNNFNRDAIDIASDTFIQYHDPFNRSLLTQISYDYFSTIEEDLINSLLALKARQKEK